MPEVGELLGRLQEFMNLVILGTPLYKFTLALLFFLIFLFFRKLAIFLVVKSLFRLARRNPHGD
ncbi:MAG: hypothetical protein Q9N34_05905 [Aquificota bacterium]|nr:hypothetical protein [Aquificota bacterium]